MLRGVKGGTIHIEVAICSSRGGWHCVGNRMYKMQQQIKEAGDQNRAHPPHAGVLVLPTCRSPRIVRAVLAAGENSQNLFFRNAWSCEDESCSSASVRIY